MGNKAQRSIANIAGLELETNPTGFKSSDAELRPTRFTLAGFTHHRLQKVI